MILQIPPSATQEERMTMMYFVAQYYENVGEECVPLYWSVLEANSPARKAFITDANGEVQRHFSGKPCHPFAQCSEQNIPGYGNVEIYHLQNGQIGLSEHLTDEEGNELS